MKRSESFHVTVAACAAILSLCSLASGKVIYVDDEALGPGNGLAWETAYKFLQDALAEAGTVPEPVEIRVAQGVYRPDQGSSVQAGDREAAFALTDGISVLGGFAGICAPDPAARDIDAYPTVLSGDLQENDIWWADMTAAVPAEVADSHLDNSECIVDAGGSGPTAVLDGLHIKGIWYPGRTLGHGETINLDRQGGVFINGGSPTVRTCVFVENLACSVKNVNRGHPTFTACRFVRNHYRYAPAIFTNSSDVTILRCTFEGNVAVREGGAMVAANGESTVTDSMFLHNAASSTGWSGGGAILNWWSNKLHLTRCAFHNNSTGHRGGALSCGGEAVLEDCTFHANSSGYGGAVSASSTLTVKGCDFRFNRTAGFGGGMELSGRDATVSLVDSTFVGNHAGDGGAIWCNTSDLTLEGCILTGNEGRSHGGAVYFASGGVLIIDRCSMHGNRSRRGDTLGGGSCDVIIEESILWDPNAFWCYSNYSLSAGYSNISDAIEGPGNICVDPCFARPGYWDANDTPDNTSDDFWVEGDYHLKSQAGCWDPNSQSWVIDDVTSPCIDAGDPNSPVGDEPFPNGGRINIGAYAGTTEASKSYVAEPVCETVIAGDINGDCHVDWQDFAILSRHWLADNRE